MVRAVRRITLGVIVLLGICFGAFSVDSKASSGTSVIHYKNVQHTDNVVLQNVNDYSIQHVGNLSKPGDYYEISFDVVNETNADVSVEECSHPNNDQYIQYDLVYDDGKAVLVGDILKGGETVHLTYRVSYVNLILTDSYEFDAGFSLHYAQVF